MYWGGGVGKGVLQHRGAALLLRCPQPQQRPQIISQHGSNSPLCNSSPTASTGVPWEKSIWFLFLKKVLRFEWTPVLMCILPTAEREHACNVLKKCSQKRGHRAWKSNSSWMREVRDKGTSTTSWNSFINLMIANAEYVTKMLLFCHLKL